jgi:acyl carrier protein
MDQTSILQQLTAIFREVFDDPDLVLTQATTAADVPGWDSMNHITVVVATEQHFGIKFQTAEIERLQNVGEYTSVIAAKLAKLGR